MKKWMTLCLALLFLFSFIGCDKDIPRDNRIRSYKTALSWANWTTSPEIKASAQNSAALANGTDHLPVFLCRTSQELETFQENFSDIFDMTSAWDEVPSFEAVTADFDEDFFRENLLLFIYIETNSCTYRFDVDTVTCSDGTLCVSVKQTNDPSFADEAMGGFLIAVSLRHEDLQNIHAYDAVWT